MLTLPTAEAPGCIHAGLDAEIYHSIQAVSSTDLKQWSSMTPREWQHWKEHPFTPSDSMNLGSAIHCAVLEPDEYGKRFVAYEGRRAGADYREFAAEHTDKIILTSSQQDTVDKVIDFLYARERLHKIIEGGEAEQSYFHLDVDGRMRKARADWVGDMGDKRVVIDLKTTFDLRDRMLATTMAKYKYHLQAAYYMDVISAAEGRPLDGFAILWVKTTDPVDMRVAIVGENTIAQGRKEYKQAWEEMHACIESGHFPGYSSEPSILDLPNWAIDND